MIRVGGEPYGGPGDTEFCGLTYPEGDEISKHMAARLQAEPFYQHDKLAQALKVVPARRAAIDCGAWVGGWSRELARHFQNVVAIEANPDNARCVMANTPSNVIVRNMAVGEGGGMICVASYENGAKVASRCVELGAGARRVQLRKLDDIDVVRTLPAIDYIKVHVNGMELKALRGMVETLKRHRPVLTVVLKPAIEAFGDTAEDARIFLRSLSYAAKGGEKPYEIWCPQ